jgi:hypothetical protein
LIGVDAELQWRVIVRPRHHFRPQSAGIRIGVLVRARWEPVLEKVGVRRTHWVEPVRGRRRLFNPCERMNCNCRRSVYSPNPAVTPFLRSKWRFYVRTYVYLVFVPRQRANIRLSIALKEFIVTIAIATFS